MGKDTGISWTDHTFNPWWGCTKVSPGCDNCYAETFDKRTHPIEIMPATEDRKAIIAAKHWGPGSPRRTFGEKHWNEPIKWNRAAEKSGVRAFVFCASMADVMDDEAPAGEREKLWALIDATPYLTWQLLTKRPQRFERYLPREFKHKNVILMVTAENQEFYKVRFPYVVWSASRRELQVGISYEPALGPLTLLPIRAVPDWIIFGGESGPGRRPCETKWAEDLKAECEKYDVKFFVKQMSAPTPAQGKALIPAHLLIQEMP